jgi:hypothetical protein
MDGAYEKARSVLSRCPAGIAAIAAKALSLAALPVAGLFLRRKIRVSGGKPLSQTVLENLFSPVGLSKIDPEDVRDHFARMGFETSEVKGIEGVDFYSGETIFICKAKRA